MTAPATSCLQCGAATPPGYRACSATCDLALRLPKGDGQLPATWQLGVLLGWCFLAFNQLLFFGMSVLAAGRGMAASMENFARISLAAGATLLLANLFFFAISKPKRMADVVGFVAALALGAVVAFAFESKAVPPLVYGAALGNVLTMIWLLRGLSRSRPSKKREKR